MTTLNYNNAGTPAVVSPVYSIPSVLAILAAVGTFLVGPGLAMFLAIAAIVLGAIGVLLAILPSRRGGVISILSIALGGIAFLIAIVRMIA